MEESRIRSFLMRDRYARNELGGVLARNELPDSIGLKPRTYVVNTETRKQGGLHWLTLHFPKNGPPEFFDSLGEDARHYSLDLERFLLKDGRSYSKNKSRIQNYGSDLCGVYCCYFAYYRSRGVVMNNILNSFSCNLKKNDQEMMVFSDEKNV